MPPAETPPRGDADTPTIIALQPTASGLPLGFSGLAMAALVITGFDLGWIGTPEERVAGVLILAVAVPLQLMCALLAIRGRDGATAGSISVVMVTWLSIGLVHVVAPGETTSDALGLQLAVATVLLLAAAPAVGTGKPLAAVVFVAAAVRFGLDAVFQLSGNAAWQDAAGAAGLAVVALAVYAMAAFEFEALENKAVLPTFRRGAGKAALEAPPPEQIGDVGHDAGIRSQV